MATDENALELLENLLREHQVAEAGIRAYLRIFDKFLSLSMEFRDRENLDFMLDIRTSGNIQVDLLKKDIQLLREEIEREKASPSDIPMGYRIYSLPGHL